MFSARISHKYCAPTMPSKRKKRLKLWITIDLIWEIVVMRYIYAKQACHRRGRGQSILCLEKRVHSTTRKHKARCASDFVRLSIRSQTSTLMDTWLVQSPRSYAFCLGSNSAVSSSSLATDLEEASSPPLHHVVLACPVSVPSRLTDLDCSAFFDSPQTSQH